MNKLLDGMDGGEGGSSKNLVFTAHSQADFPEPVVYIISWAVGGAGPWCWGGRGATAGELLSQYRRSGELQLEE